MHHKLPEPDTVEKTEKPNVPGSIHVGYKIVARQQRIAHEGQQTIILTLDNVIVGCNQVEFRQCIALCHRTEQFRHRLKRLAPRSDANTRQHRVGPDRNGQGPCGHGTGSIVAHVEGLEGAVHL